MAELHRAAEATRAVLRTWVRCECWGAWEGRTASCWRLGCDSGTHGDGGGEALPNENEKSVISAPAASHSRTRASWWGSAYLSHMPSLPAHVLGPALLQRCPGCPFAVVHWHQCHGGGGGIRSVLGLAHLDSLGRALGAAASTASLRMWGDRRAVPFLPSTLPDILLPSPAWVPESARA